MSIGIYLIVIFIALFIYIYKRLPLKPEHVISELKEKHAALIYSDHNNKKYFSSNIHRISAKPDFLYKMSDDSHVIVEYKSRYGSVKDRDIAQLIATAIAVKESYPTLYRGYIYTQSRQIKTIDLTLSINQLLELIKVEVDHVRQIASGYSPVFQLKKESCQVCGLRKICELRC